MPIYSNAVITIGEIITQFFKRGDVNAAEWGIDETKFDVNANASSVETLLYALLRYYEPSLSADEYRRFMKGTPLYCITSRLSERLTNA